MGTKSRFSSPGDPSDEPPWGCSQAEHHLEGPDADGNSDEKCYWKNTEKWEHKQRQTKAMKNMWFYGFTSFSEDQLLRTHEKCSEAKHPNEEGKLCNIMKHHKFLFRWSVVYQPSRRCWKWQQQLAGAVATTERLPPGTRRHGTDLFESWSAWNILKSTLSDAQWNV